MKQKTGNGTERIKLRQHNGEYWTAIVALCLSGIIYVVLFILDKCTHMIAWGDNNYYNSVGVVCQIAGAIACFLFTVVLLPKLSRNRLTCIKTSTRPGVTIQDESKISQ